MRITLRQAAEAVHRAEQGLADLIEKLEANPKRRDLPDLPMRRSHRAELEATYRLLYRLADHQQAVKELLHVSELSPQD